LLDLIIARLPLKARERVFLCGRFGSECELTGLDAAEAERVCARGMEQGELFGRKTPRWSMAEAVEKAKRDADYIERRGIRYVSIASPGYPPLLREIHDPPAVLFYIGTLPPPGLPAVAIVGTRVPRASALRWAYDAGRDLGRAGAVAVSGLAFGVDAMAHRGCVEAGAVTLAVLGSAADEIYPAPNRPLARRIVAGGGAVLSEYPPGTRPSRWTFPARNRIISGLCRCTVIVEAGEKSGALITADFALEQNRDLFVAGDADGAVFGEGCRRLAEDGAKVMRTADDILAELGGSY
jgi:DNA processing protein